MISAECWVPPEVREGEATRAVEAACGAAYLALTAACAADLSEVNVCSELREAYDALCRVYDVLAAR